MTDSTEKTVLVVDDERDLADMVAAWLADEWTVRVAYDGESALELVDEDVDVVLLDRRMPGFSGDDVLEEIGARGLDPMVAMLTAVEPDLDVLAMGFDDYLVKPVLASDVLTAVDRLATRATYEDDLRQHFALASKRAALEAYRSTGHLESRPEYEQLTADLDALSADLDETLASFDDATFEAMFRERDRPSL